MLNRYQNLLLNNKDEVFQKPTGPVSKQSRQSSILNLRRIISSVLSQPEIRFPEIIQNATAPKQ